MLHASDCDRDARWQEIAEIKWTQTWSGLDSSFPTPALPRMMRAELKDLSLLLK